MQIINIAINIGRLLGHLKGAWKCSCEIAVIIDTALQNEIPDLDPDTGL